MANKWIIQANKKKNKGSICNINIFKINKKRPSIKKAFFIFTTNYTKYPVIVIIVLPFAGTVMFGPVPDGMVKKFVPLNV